MKLIIGLGNPGIRYKKTKHNAGFWVIDKIADTQNIAFNKRKFNTQCAEFNYHQDNVLLVKPLTYMNLSGQAVKNLVDYFKVPLDNTLIIFDDVSLILGTIRLRESGSAGGHQGLASVIEYLGTNRINRLRFGIKTQTQYNDLANFVLKGFSNKEEKLAAEQTVTLAQAAVFCWLDAGIKSAMNSYNKKRR
ncbi:MAG: aminoacyl-tRNA hydrolase [Candidatus Omnitrophota bacterium]